jgi:hypothetical protein
LTVTPKNNLLIYPSFCMRYNFAHKSPVDYNINFAARSMVKIKISVDQVISDISFSPNEESMYYSTYSLHGEQYVDEYGCRTTDGKILERLFPLIVQFTKRVWLQQHINGIMQSQ